MFCLKNPTPRSKNKLKFIKIRTKSRESIKPGQWTLDTGHGHWTLDMDSKVYFQNDYSVTRNNKFNEYE